MSNVVNLHEYTRLAIDPDNVLEGAKGELAEVLVIGHCKDGSDWFAASTSDGGKLLWLLELFKHKLMRGDFGEDD
ncbi:MAG: hypothetical protein PHT88_04895 [Candidatus Moranbacteria bacterium]|nr:hypothetical protein [Candidatus Moranbacteria bacterium]